MFKSIQWKVVTMFVLLVFSVVVIVGTFLLNGVNKFYNSAFIVNMDQIFNQDFVKSLDKLISDEVSYDKIFSATSAYSGQIGTSTTRNLYILDATTGAFLVGTTTLDKGVSLEKTFNIITAMTGAIGKTIYSQNDYMDYATPVRSNDTPKYIVYVKDTKDDLRNLIQNIFWIIIQTLIVATIISSILGFFLSRTITKPIIDLTNRAKKLASGDFENMPLVKSDDEIGVLSNTFGYMSSELSATLNEIEGEKTKMQTIFENMTDGLLAFDAEGNQTYINNEAMNMLLIDPSTQIEFNEFFKSKNVDISLGDLLYIAHNKPLERMVHVNDLYLKATFAKFSVEKSVNNDKLVGIIVVLHDNTKQEKLELSRKEFVANVSHELRTPLTIIKSYAETIMSMQDIDIETSNHFLGVIESEADRMTRIVKDLLTLSHFDHNKNEIKKEPVDIQKLIGFILEKLSFEAKAHDHVLSYTKTSPIPQIMVDRDKIEQVLINILSNAIKYTPDNGKIEVFTGKLYGDLYIKVVDNGIGIPKEDLSHIFDRFYRVDKDRSRKTGGTGLGLAIAKEIVESHNGKITINSEVNKGTEIIIFLPEN